MTKVQPIVKLLAYYGVISLTKKKFPDIRKIQELRKNLEDFKNTLGKNCDQNTI